MEKPFLLGSNKLDETALRKIFLYNLNQAYLVLLQLAGGLPKLAEETHFGDLQNVVEGFLSEVKAQVSRVNDIFALLKEVPVVQGGPGFDGLLKTLVPDYGYEPSDGLLKDLSFIFYLQRVVVIKKGYFYMLISVAAPLNIAGVKQLLQYCCDDCEDNQVVLRLIAKEYMQSTINNFLV